MSEPKLKHSYSLTSLSSRFLSQYNNHLPNNSHNNGNGHGYSQAQPQNHHHHPKELEPEGGDDYGFLSGGFKEHLPNVPGGKQPTTTNTNLFPSHATTSVPPGPLASGCKNTNTPKHQAGQGHQPFSWSGQLSTLTSGKRNNNGEQSSACGWFEESGKGVPGLSQRLGNLSLSTNKLNGSCQALNSSETSGGGLIGFSSKKHASGNNGHRGDTNGVHLAHNEDPKDPWLVWDEYESHGDTWRERPHQQGQGSNKGEYKNGHLSPSGGGGHGKPNPKNGLTGNLPAPTSSRVRRTLSCYVKHPQQTQGFRSLLETDSASTLNVTTIPEKSEFGSSLYHGGTGNHHHHHQQQQSSFNPVCEFSPYSSLSSNDLLRLTGPGTRDPPGYFGDRKVSDSAVFFHDNPVDCGCSACFNVKLQVILKVKSIILCPMFY